MVSRTDFQILKNNLTDMEDECKNSLGYISMAGNYSQDTRDLVKMFLENAAERIMSMTIIFDKVMAEYKNLLSGFGLPLRIHKARFLRQGVPQKMSRFKLIRKTPYCWNHNQYYWGLCINFYSKCYI